MIMEMCISIISTYLSIDIKHIKKILYKKNNNEEKLEITENIDDVRKKLEDSKLILDNALHAMENQKNYLSK